MLTTKTNRKACVWVALCLVLSIVLNMALSMTASATNMSESLNDVASSTSVTSFDPWSYPGFQMIAPEEMTVYWDTGLTNYKGKIFKLESFSVLDIDNDTHPSWMEVEYSTSSGPKQGYTKTFWDTFEDLTQDNHCCLGTVKTTSTLYYGHDTNAFAVAGTVYAGELVAILAKNDDWVFVEYNTNSGRKRGYMRYSALDVSDLRPSVFPDLYTWDTSNLETETLGSDEYYNVYSGPTSQFPKIGSVGGETIYILGYEPVHFIENGEWVYRYATYIEYFISGTNQRKTGYIVPSGL